MVNAAGAVAEAKTLQIGINASETNVGGTHLNDVFFDGAGSHTISGDGGIDTLTFISASAGTLVFMGDGVANNGFGGLDHFSGIQNFGGSGFDDTFAAGAGSHFVNGDGGHDTLTLRGTAASYAVTEGSGSIVTVADSTTSRDGSTGTFGVEVLQFADKAEFVESRGESDIAALYSAAFGRTTDAPGLVGWEKIYEQSVPAEAKGQSAFVALAETDPTGMFTSIAGGFTQSAEFQQKYGALSDTAFVTQLYENVLGRAPEQAGLDTWLNLMQVGDASGLHYTREMVLVGFAASPENYTKITADWLHLV